MKNQDADQCHICKKETSRDQLITMSDLTNYISLKNMQEFWEAHDYFPTNETLICKKCIEFPKLD